MALGILSAAARPVIAAIFPSTGCCGAQQCGEKPQGHGGCCARRREPRREKRCSWAWERWDKYGKIMGIKHIKRVVTLINYPQVGFTMI